MRRFFKAPPHKKTRAWRHSGCPGELPQGAETPIPLCRPCRADLRCLQRMMRPAKALAVAQIECRAAILQFADMVGEHPPLGPVATRPFAAPAGAPDHRRPP